MMSAEKVFFSHPECHGEGHRKKLLLKIEKNLIQYVQMRHAASELAYHFTHYLSFSVSF